MVPGPAADLSYVVHPWVVPSTPAARGRLVAGYDNETVFGLLLEELSGEGHRAIRRDATLGAAGRRGRRRRHCGARAPRTQEEAADEPRSLPGPRHPARAVDEVLAAVEPTPRAGGVVSFLGTVREPDAAAT